MKTYKDFDSLAFDIDKYKYQKELTIELDNSINKPLTQDLLNEIVLWKVNRYATVNDDTFDLINQISPDSKNINEDLTRRILRELLSNESKGIQLAMASTILRFRNPNIYQIIDQRAYRLATGFSLKLSQSSSQKNIEAQIDLYLAYLRKLHEIAEEKKCDFTMLDRVLYYLDKDEDGNKEILLNNYGTKNIITNNEQ